MPAQEQPNRPNILCIMSDEHDPAVLGCYGDDIVRSPRLDRLAAEGVTFDAAYTTSPLCVPARLSFTAGQYVSRCGAWSNSCRLPSDDYPSLFHALNAVGYDCVLGGKMHYDKDRRYGFTDLHETDQNQYVKNGRGVRRDPADLVANVKTWTSRSSQFFAADDSKVLSLDRDVTGNCSDFLRNRSADANPFFLLAGYLSPHFPLIVPEEIAKHYRDRVPMPNLPEGTVENLPLNYHHLRYGFGMVDQDPEVVKKGRELYWAFVEWMDIEISKLLDALGDSEAADNTIVIYTSDHGENKGDHGLWWKNNMYEHSARIPLIVSWPARWAGGQRRTEACSLVDLTKTIADLCGAEIHPTWDGESMVNWLDNPDADWRDLALSEYYAHNIASGFTMVRRGPWKYVYHTRMDETHGPERELYNLDDDPEEFANLAADPAHADRVAAMHALMLEELGEDPEDIEKRCREDYAKGYPDVE